MNRRFSTRVLRASAWLCMLALLLAPCWAGVAQASFFGGFGIKDEKEMGRKFEVMVRSRLPLVEDPAAFEAELRALDVPAADVRHPGVFGRIRHAGSRPCNSGLTTSPYKC